MSEIIPTNWMCILSIAHFVNTLLTRIHENKCCYSQSQTLQSLQVWHLAKSLGYLRPWLTMIHYDPLKSQKKSFFIFLKAYLHWH